MKNKIGLLLCVATILTIIIASCGSEVKPDDTKKRPIVTVVTAEPLVDLPTPTGSYDPGFVDVGTRFELTEKQRLLFEEYITNLDIEIFRDADPIDIAHVFIECGNNGSWEAEYMLYAQEGLAITKEQAHLYHIKDMEESDLRTRRDKANIVFAFLQDGVFTETGDNKGQIDYLSLLLDSIGYYMSDEKQGMIMRLIKEDGIWLIKWNPFDDYE